MHGTVFEDYLRRFGKMFGFKSAGNRKSLVLCEHKNVKAENRT